MRFAVLDQMRCSCGSEDFRLEPTVTVTGSYGAAAPRCRKVCWRTQRPILTNEDEPSECLQCHRQNILNGVIHCKCGQDWQIIDGIPGFSIRLVLRIASLGLRVVETNPQTDPRWEAFVLSHPEGSVYHHPQWILALEEEFGQKGTHLACEDNDGRLLAVLPMLYTRGIPFNLGGPLTGRRLSSLPRTPLAGPLSQNALATTAVVQAAIQRVQEAPGVCLQIKTQGAALDGVVPGLMGVLWRGAYVLALPENPSLFRIPNAKNREVIKWAVNKAARLGVQVRSAESRRDLHDWYGLYLETMRRNAVPARPYRFFDALWEHLRPRGLMQVLLAEQEHAGHRRILAGLVLLMMGNRVTRAFSGSRRDALSMRPNDAIQWHAVKDACSGAFRWFDFGEVAEEHPELAKFKSKWGAELTPLYRYYYSAPADSGAVETRSGGYRRLPIATLWRQLPLTATAWLGDRIYRYL